MKRNQVQQRKILENLEDVYGKQSISLDDLIEKARTYVARISTLEARLDTAEVKFANLIQVLKEKKII